MLESILVVDSDISARDTFYEVLSSIGYKVTCVPNGSEALVRLERERFSLIILDEKIPPMEWGDLTAKIRELDEEVSFILLSREDPSQELRNKAVTTGVLAVIKKDFSTHFMMKEILGILKEGVRELKRENRSGSILVIDDEFEIRTMISNFLSIKGYNVTTASSGEEALMKIKLQKPNLVFCDIRMPGMDGLMVLGKIKEIDPAIKVVMLTAVQDEDLVAAALKGEASDYLVKPYSLMRLDALALSILPR